MWSVRIAKMGGWVKVMMHAQGQKRSLIGKDLGGDWDEECEEEELRWDKEK